MVAFKFLALALSICGVLAEEPWMPPGMSKKEYEELRGKDGTPLAPAELAVEVTTAFPGADVFGIKLINGKPTKTRIHMMNHESDDIYLRLINGGLYTALDTPGAPKRQMPLANLTTKGFMLKIAPGKMETAIYSFKTDIHPQDVNLVLQAVWQDPAGELVQKVVYNGTVATVDPPMSLFDPQVIFLYLVLALAFGGTCWFIYSTWITAFFPQKKRGGKGGERAKRSSGGSKAVDPSNQASVIGADGPATTTGAKAYDESWIPAEHLKRPEPKRMGSGRPKSRAA